EGVVHVGGVGQHLAAGRQHERAVPPHQRLERGRVLVVEEAGEQDRFGPAALLVGRERLPQVTDATIQNVGRHRRGPPGARGISCHSAARGLRRHNIFPHSFAARGFTSPSSFARPGSTTTEATTVTASAPSPAAAFTSYFRPGTNPSRRNRPSAPVVAWTRS